MAYIAQIKFDFGREAANTPVNHNPLMKNTGVEFSKLDEIDREVSLWILENLQVKRIRSWIEYIVLDYQRRKHVNIDADKLYNEIMER